MSLSVTVQPVLDLKSAQAIHAVVNESPVDSVST